MIVKTPVSASAESRMACLPRSHAVSLPRNLVHPSFVHLRSFLRFTRDLGLIVLVHRASFLFPRQGLVAREHTNMDEDTRPGTASSDVRRLDTSTTQQSCWSRCTSLILSVMGKERRQRS
jgi:hypothetical protein